jgi:hypothetical protein
MVQDPARHPPTITDTPYRIVVYLAAGHRRLYRLGKQIMHAPAGIGTAVPRLVANRKSSIQNPWHFRLHLRLRLKQMHRISRIPGSRQR